MIAAEQETQRVKDLRFAHRFWSFTVDPRTLVLIDETGMPLGLTRRYGRVPKGERLHDSDAPGNPGQNISLIGAMSLDGLIATFSVLGSVNTDVFLFYVQEILMPQLWVGAIVLMANLPVHHAQVMREAIEAAGAKLVFLPPIHQTSHRRASPRRRRMSCAGQSSSNSCVLPRLAPGKHLTKRSLE